MTTYDQTSQELSQQLIKSFSTSFSLGARFFSKDVRRHIGNIYGMVRVADEVVDTYRGDQVEVILEELRLDVHRAVQTKFSANPAVHAYQITARKFSIKPDVVNAFFNSMYIDISKKTFNKKEYDSYIFGSAEAVGLMCLSVYVEGDDKQYDKLKAGAQALGSAFQKVNFLRDLAEDHEILGRYYFPVGSFETFNNQIRDQVVADIKADFAKAEPDIERLPSSAKIGVKLAYVYFKELLEKIEKTDASDIKKQRIRIPDFQKAIRMIQTVSKDKLNGSGSE